MHFEQLHTHTAHSFHVICSIAPEYMDPADSFDSSVDDISEIYRKIDNGFYVWFRVRVEAYMHGVLLGRAYLGGCLYENAQEIITDGTFDDLMGEAISEAGQVLSKLREA